MFGKRWAAGAFGVLAIACWASLAQATDGAGNRKTKGPARAAAARGDLAQTQPVGYYSYYSYDYYPRKKYYRRYYRGSYYRPYGSYYYPRYRSYYPRYRHKYRYYRPNYYRHRRYYY